MAQQRIGNKEGVAACNNVSGTQRSNMSGSTASPSQEYFDAGTPHIETMRTRLAAIDAGFYTAARLNAMTYNDMVYAVRRNDAPGTIK